MKKSLISLFALLCFSNLSFSQINLAAGGGGSTTGVGQSFNETRGIDATVVSSTDVFMQSITLSGFFSGLNGTGTAYVGVRIYNSTNFNLLASSPFDTVSNVMGGSVTIPLNFTFTSGSTYRISIFCGGPNPPTHNSALMYQPGSFPYTELSNQFMIMHAWAFPADTIPVNTNIFVPLMTINTIAAGVEEPIVESVKIFHNPASAYITIDNPKHDKEVIAFIDLTGKEIGSIKVDALSRINVDITKYPDFFFVKTSEANVTKVVKINQ